MARGHFAANITAKKILDACYWLPTLFKDIHEFCRSYDNCQRTEGLKK
jgi:hypothetical protein